MRNYSKILLCLDLTDDSDRIAERARTLAAASGAEITLLHVVEYVPVEPMGEALLPAVQIEGELVERARVRIAELAARAGLDHCERLVNTGNIKTEVVRVAQTRAHRPDRDRQPGAPRGLDPVQLHRGHRAARCTLRRARRAPAARVIHATAGRMNASNHSHQRRRRDAVRRGPVEPGRRPLRVRLHDHHPQRGQGARRACCRATGSSPTPTARCRKWWATAWSASSPTSSQARASGTRAARSSRRRSALDARPLPHGGRRWRALRRADRALHARRARPAALTADGGLGRRRPPGLLRRTRGAARAHRLHVRRATSCGSWATSSTAGRTRSRCCDGSSDSATTHASCSATMTCTCSPSPAATRSSAVATARCSRSSTRPTASACSTGCSRARCCTTTARSATPWCTPDWRRSGTSPSPAAVRPSSRAALRGERSDSPFRGHVRQPAGSAGGTTSRVTERLRFITNALTRLRVCDASGRLLLEFKGPLDELPPEAMPWFRAPRRRWDGARIVCGHWSALGYVDENGVLGLDTGCVWGGTLTAQRLDAPGTRVSIPSTLPAVF